MSIFYSIDDPLFKQINQVNLNSLNTKQKILYDTKWDLCAKVAKMYFTLYHQTKSLVGFSRCQDHQ